MHRSLTAIRNDAKSQFGVNSLLGSNPKVIKSNKHKVLTAILHLKPEITEFGSLKIKRNVCPYAGNCAALCLNSSGNPAYRKGKELARYNRTKMYWYGRELFLELLHAEIQSHIRKADRMGYKPAIRLNGTSDIKWETLNVPQTYPDIQFYDYTKFPLGSRQVPANYHLTYSYDDHNDWYRYHAILKTGNNLAVAFQGFKALPSSYMGYKVIDGDLTDYRPDDQSGVIVGLLAKRLTDGTSNQNNGFFVTESMCLDLNIAA